MFILSCNIDTLGGPSLQEGLLSRNDQSGAQIILASPQ